MFATIKIVKIVNNIQNAFLSFFDVPKIEEFDFHAQPVHVLAKPVITYSNDFDDLPSCSK
ncbi:Uncharacterised protein [Mycoplasmopsis arginini]|nr:Uncharacterised protein [Chlamydia abortus]SGA08623.1 Uncharacterised protein [Mycoplasmopsis arginini]SGA30393.1 Uncharacterised protein [Mycoplasmopsis arginini]SGA31952.1 Uncharacterised protein [Chlamydia abortus]